MQAHNIISINELEQKAKEILEPSSFDFIAGGAGNEWGVANNRNSFQSYQIVPRILQNVSEIDTSFEMLGVKIASPVMIAPCAFHKLVCPDGERATAKAAAHQKTIFTLSTMSSYSIEEVADVSNFPMWFQLYVFKDREVTKQLIQRAENAGYRAIVVTVDVPAMGMRQRDITNKFCLPSNVEAANFSVVGLSSLSDKSNGSKIKDHTDQQFDSGFTWETIDWLWSITKLPIILKGILNPEDAVEALNHAVSAIIISNHGGRQIDGVVASIDALADIAPALKNRIPLIVDGGISTGEDIFKALALGASAVMIARPVMWALAVGGEAELVVLLKKLQEELTLIMRLTGCRNLDLVKERGLSLLTGASLLSRKLLALQNQINQLNAELPEKAPVRKLSWLS